MWFFVGVLVTLLAVYIYESKVGKGVFGGMIVKQ